MTGYALRRQRQSERMEQREKREREREGAERAAIVNGLTIPRGRRYLST